MIKDIGEHPDGREALGQGMWEAPDPLWADHSSGTSMCSPTWELLNPYMWDLSGGFVMYV